MKMVLILTGIGLFPLALFSCGAEMRVAQPPPPPPRQEAPPAVVELAPAAPEHVSVPPGVGIGWGEVPRLQRPEDDFMPIRKLEYKFYSRAGPKKHKVVEKDLAKND
ncbi:MAG TPA: hypothetical protein VNM14_10220 [Planctomycetota bacterium]|jgi:hypothetical protein|nr:hypothetical protein [Planctomycetota bacterium]